MNSPHTCKEYTMYTLQRVTLVVCLLTSLLSPCSTRVCSSQVSQGPYHLVSEKTTPTMLPEWNATFTHVHVESDAVIMIAYRAYWMSYCYNGGPLDSNTGCIDTYQNYLPDEKEAREWEVNKGCRVQSDCKDCWGTDSDQCTGDWLHNRPWHYTEAKELVRASNNNHFAHHTCNLQWRCGFHESKWETFLSSEDNEIIPYVVQKDGSPINVHDLGYQRFKDFSLLLVAPPRIISQTVHIGCHGINADLCYDEKYGNLIKFEGDGTYCFPKDCYSIEQTHSYNAAAEKHHAKLKAASLEDLRAMHLDLVLINSEMKYDFIIARKELEDLKKTVRIMIESLAKIDDRLIGEILERPARTKFLSKKQFLLSPCSEDPLTTSNCVNNTIFSDGRWIRNDDPTKCISFNHSQNMTLWKHESYWIPDIVDHKTFGTVGEQEGWSFYAAEKSTLTETMLFTKNMGKTSSLSDAFSLPPGTILQTLWHGKILTIVFIIFAIGVCLVLVRICLRLFH